MDVSFSFFIIFLFLFTLLWGGIEVLVDGLELEKAHVEEGEQEDPEADPENNNLCHQPLVAGRLVERARSTNITGVNDVAIDENGEAIE